MHRAAARRISARIPSGTLAGVALRDERYEPYEPAALLL